MNRNKTGDKIKQRWDEYKREMVTDIAVTAKCENESVNEKRLILLFLVGIVYASVGGVICFSKKEFDVSNVNLIFIGIELAVLGIYALLNVGMSYCIYCKQEKHSSLDVVIDFLVVLLWPYNFVIKVVKKIIRQGKQEHVSNLYVDYMVSALIVLVSYYILVRCIVLIDFDEVFNSAIGFVLVIVLIYEFFLCGRGVAYISTKQLVKSIQKNEVKKISKENWRKVYNSSKYKIMRKNRFEKEWSIIKNELVYTKLYFYIILMVLIMLIPKVPGSVGELLSNQFMGITTIAALGREAKSRM